MRYSETDITKKQEHSPFAAYILAGGKSSRMGSEKGLVEINGKPFIAYILEAVRPCVSNLFIIANSTHYHHLGIPVLSDDIKGIGPLGGIVTALTHSPSPFNLILSCDIPFINSNTIRFILEQTQPNKQANITVYNQETQPLCSVYNKTSLPILKKNAEGSDHSLRKMISQLEVSYTHLDGQTLSNPYALTNINTPKELSEALEQSYIKYI